MPKHIFVYLFFILIVFSVSSCVEKETYPVEPELTYLSFSQNATNLCYLELKFIDGDGDIGLADHQTQPPFDTTSLYYNNLFLTVFQKINGNIEPFFVNEAQTDTLKFNYRLKYIPPVGNQGYLKGTFKIEISDPLWLSKAYLHSDTILFHCRLYDRALHPSNLLITPEIIVKRY